MISASQGLSPGTAQATQPELPSWDPATGDLEGSHPSAAGGAGLRNEKHEEKEGRHVQHEHRRRVRATHDRRVKDGVGIERGQQEDVHSASVRRLLKGLRHGGEGRNVQHERQRRVRAVQDRRAKDEVGIAYRQRDDVHSAGVHLLHKGLRHGKDLGVIMGRTARVSEGDVVRVGWRRVAVSANTAGDPINDPEPQKKDSTGQPAAAAAAAAAPRVAASMQLQGSGAELEAFSFLRTASLFASTSLAPLSFEWLIDSRTLLQKPSPPRRCLSKVADSSRCNSTSAAC